MTLRPVTQKRNYGVDALRILSMLMIAVHHITTHGGLLKSRELFSFGYDSLVFLEMTVLCAVNCYVLISGYVGVYSRHKYANLAALWLQVFLYSAGITVIFRLINPEWVDTRTIFKSLIPTLSREYWFFTSYFILFLVMPLLNLAIEHLSRRRLEILLLSLVVFIGVGGSIYYAYYGADNLIVNRGYSAWWMMVVYMIGGYIRKYDVLGSVKKYRFLIVFFLSAALSTVLKLLLQTYSLGRYGKLLYNQAFYQYTSMNLLVCAVSLFLFFRNLDFKPAVSKVIAFLTPMTFGVYLIHDHPLVRNHVIKVVFGFAKKLSAPLMLLLIAVFAVLIYLVCSGIDLLRVYLFKWLKVKERLRKLENAVGKRLSRKKAN